MGLSCSQLINFTHNLKDPVNSTVVNFMANGLSRCMDLNTMNHLTNVGWVKSARPGLSNIRIRSVNIGGSDHTKIRDIYQDSKTHKYDILLINTTHVLL